MRPKPDIDIGRRAAEEVLKRMGDTPAGKYMESLGLKRGVIWEWQNGSAPAATSLQRLAMHGFDVAYILTGKKRGLDLDMLGIQEVTEGTGLHIIRSYNPPDSCGRLGKYIYPEGSRWIGIDNSSGDCWVDAFGTRAECVAWLMEKEVDHG